MDSGLYAAYTGLLARTQALDTAANNLANSNTNGFRAQQDYFRGVMAGLAGETVTDDSGVGAAVNQFGILGGTRLDVSQGQINSTGNPLDLALNGSGFFEVKTAHGTQLTRDGAFLRSGDGTLTTQHGEPVLDASGAAIVLPTGSVHVGDNGDISVSTPDGGSGIVGRLAIVNYATEDLGAAGTNHFVVRDGAKATKADGQVQEGALEGANQDTVHGTMQLMLVQRQAEMMQKALNVFHNDFDKTATEELGRV
ncbi:flagellar hook-basal body proteins [Terriglobus roseus DSM 18391]|uniref:Flagellar basal-body rod protein FlgF n=1 Tax=Terriglobus roseus (strain DSM 18391 / NRRL B-41598 / KBS 63) TaxID=926566 RepID=I3ZFX0_TERRK|nr:flagellar hook basal-body protein [Terriglobus roseus]AFL88138.1 flagellar hook-basal body proteins [Terriglobus roseus DSM 18391]